MTMFAMPMPEMPQEVIDAVGADPGAFAAAMGEGMNAFQDAMAENISDSTKEARAGMATPEIMARTSAPVQYDPIRYEQQLSSGKWIECRGHPLPGGGSLAIYRDIGESKQLFAQLEELATTDALTAVPNRRSFLERAAGEFARAKRTRRNMSILMIDVDHFKASTTGTVMPRATKPCAKSPRPATAPCVVLIYWAASAARNSPPCCPRPTAPRPAW